MSVVIKYNGLEPFKTNGMPTPFVSRNSSVIFEGSRKGIQESITLSGQIYNDEEGCDDFEVLTARRTSIIDAFSEDYKSLIIEESGVDILSKDFVKVKSISFSDSRYVGQVNYSIELECIDEKLHNEFYGVKNPSNETLVSKAENGQYTIKRSISAVGINLQDGKLSGDNTSSMSSALQNAIDFVESRSGKENVLLPEGNSSLKIYLTQRSESIDRIGSSYSIEEIYIADATQGSNDFGVMRYSINTTNAFGSFTTVEISGSIEYGIEEDFEKARSRYKNFAFLSEAESKSGESLVDFPISENIVEEPAGGRINFSIVFDNDFNFNNCGISNKVDYSIENSSDKITVSVSGAVSSRGPISKRFNLVENEFYNNIKSNIFSNAKTELESYYQSQPVPTPTPGTCEERIPSSELKSTPSSYSIKENRKKGEIQYNYLFETSDRPDGFSSFDHTSTVSLPSPSYNLKHNAGGGMDKFIISRSGFRKGSILVTCSGTYDNTNNESSAESKIRETISELIEELECSLMGVIKDKGLITRDDVSKKKEKNMISISFEKQYFNEIV